MDSLHGTTNKENIPIIKPEDCPGEVIRYFNKQRKADKLAFREMLREELAPIHHFMKMATGNRIWLVALSSVVFVVGMILLIHLM